MSLTHRVIIVNSGTVKPVVFDEIVYYRFHIQQSKVKREFNLGECSGNANDCLNHENDIVSIYKI
ncbi:hypothetical protein CLV99_4750 [Sphingobacterium yanglingense]|uniref:Uncharacterized protein n=1 Tax=Sphingobacterium yanglingense TaxID=1437280 RepID=A0A4V3DCK4_9SPHI|nr:hypothetical protein CLV99_4750 [Sphingobacterium yanglingense]